MAISIGLLVAQPARGSGTAPPDPPPPPTGWVLSVGDGSVAIASSPNPGSAAPTVVSTGDQTVTVS
jgi:hypothetical protein